MVGDRLPAVKVIFFGIVDSDRRMGHRATTPEGDGVPYRDLCSALGVPHIDGTMAPRSTEEQGAAVITFLERWTVLAWWDRTGDTRGKSNSALIVEGNHSFARMLELLAEHFPGVAHRQPSPWLAPKS